MKQITETFSEEYYAAGLGLPAMYLKLNAEKKEHIALTVIAWNLG